MRKQLPLYTLSFARLLAMLAPAAIAATCAWACTQPEAAPPASAPRNLGPNPLRRLSNAEYANALTDLFPGVEIALPSLPQDTEIAGFDNAAQAQKPSDVRIARSEEIANLYAAAATASPALVRQLAGCSYATPVEATACASQFIARNGLRIYRRPLELAERTRLESRFAGWQSAIDFEAAAQLTLATMLQAPQFLYRTEPREAPERAGESPAEALLLGPYAMATRLSFLLWESTSDAVLLDAAARGELASDAQIEMQVRRMLEDPRARRVYWSFHRQWLGLGRLSGTEHAARAPEIDPNWSPLTQASASREIQLTVQAVVANGGGLRELLTSRLAFVNPDLARVYGVETPPGNGFAEIELPAAQRSGVLTRIAFLAAFSHPNGNSPPLRGSGVVTHLLCQSIGAPPPDADLSQPMPQPGDGPKTTRQLFEERTAPAACAGCHQQLNGIGFGFEHYNAAGAYQTQERGLPIHARGTAVGTEDGAEFDGAIALSEQLSKSKTVYACAAQQWLRYAFAREPDALETNWSSATAEAFLAAGGNVQQLLLRIALSPSFRHQRAADTGRAPFPGEQP